MKYQLRTGVGAPADVVAKEITRIIGKHGAATAEVVLDESRPADAALHCAFVWDDTKAGELYRMQQARNLIRAVHLTEVDGSDGGCAFVRVTDFEEEGARSKYLPVAQVVQHPDLFAYAVRALSGNVEAARRALEDLHAQAMKSGAKNEAALAKAGRGLDIASKNLKQAARK